MSHDNWLYHKLAIKPEKNLTKTSGYIMRVCENQDVRRKQLIALRLLLYCDINILVEAIKGTCAGSA